MWLWTGNRVTPSPRSNGNQEKGIYQETRGLTRQAIRTSLPDRRIEVIEIQHEELKGWKDQRIFPPDRSEFHLEVIQRGSS